MSWRHLWEVTTNGYITAALGKYLPLLDIAEELLHPKLGASPLKDFRSWLMECECAGLLTREERASISFIHTSCMPKGSKFFDSP